MFAALPQVMVLLVALSCSEDGDAPAGGTGGAQAGSASAAGGDESGGTSSGGSSAGSAAGGAAGSAGEGGATSSGAGGSSSGGASGGGASGATAGEGGSTDGGTEPDDAGAPDDDGGVAAGAGDGEPCPNGNDCGPGLICVGYGNPLPNGESTACRRICTAGAPPPDCTCAGGGYCEQSAGNGGTGGGSASFDGGGNCGEVIVNPGCADADEATTDFQSGEFQGCLHWRNLGEGQGWIHYETFGGFHYDLTTSLGWVIRTNSGTMTLAEAAAFCDTFSIVGLSDWRLPTIDEARSLAGGCAETASGGSCPLSDSSCLNASCGIGDDCTSCLANVGPFAPGNYYCRPDVKLCSGFHTTSICPDCATAGGNWRYGTINGNFFAGSVEQQLFPVCVMENIPNAVPCSN